MTPKQQVKAALKDHPFPVEWERRWDSARIAGRGTWAPRFVMLHHTAGRDSLAVLKTTAWPPVPGASFLVDRDGTVHVISASKTYHAGKGGPRWGVAAGGMNSYAWGIEIEDLGRERTMTDAQIKSAAALAGGLLEAMGVTVSAGLIQHKEWNPRGKVDTRYTTRFWANHVRTAMQKEPTMPAFRDMTPKTSDPAVFPTDGEWHDVPGMGHLDGSPFSSPDEIHTFYCRVVADWPDDQARDPLTVKWRWVRDNGDASGHDTRQYAPGTTTIPTRGFHDEVGERGVGGRWQFKMSGDCVVTLGTRYAKLRALDVDWV